MKFYCIIRGVDDIQNTDTYSLLRQAAVDRGLEFTTLESGRIAYHKLDDIIEKDSLLYRLAGDSRSVRLEALLSDRTVTLKNDICSLLSRGFMWGSAIRIKQAGIPIIPTVFNVANDLSHIKEYVQSLGGFPVVLKAAGGSHGDGVMKFDDIESLSGALGSMLDRLSTGDIVLRRFIEDARHLRLIVLGNRVVDAIEYRPQPNDFRTNAVAEPQVDAVRDVPSQILNDAANAVKIQGLEFGGVDILIDKNSKHYIAEVNFPCNFARNQLNTGADVAGQMVDFLIEKRDRRAVL